MRNALAKCLLLGSALLPLAAQAPAAPPAPVRLKPLRVSPACTVVQDLGISQVKVAFSRPAVKGRKIWGGLVPYGQVWRMGANAATVLTLSHAARVAGREVPAGSYALFAIPGEKQWTLILSRKAEQWGAFDYRQADDLVRWEATPEPAPFQEYLDIRILPTATDGGTDAARVELSWERLRVSFPVAFDTRTLYWAHLEETLARAPRTDWVPWYQAAAYCQEHHLEPARAQAWIETSLRAQETFRNHEVAARIARDAGRTAEALAHLEKAIDLARGKAPKEYLDGLETELAAWKGGA